MRMINETALSEAIRDYFIKKIDKDEYKVDTVDCHADIQAILRSQPTAYDPDKVVEQLWKTSDCYSKGIGFCDDTNCFECRHCHLTLKQAIEIVKGGNDEVQI